MVQLSNITPHHITLIGGALYNYCGTQFGRLYPENIGRVCVAMLDHGESQATVRYFLHHPEEFLPSDGNGDVLLPWKKTTLEKVGDATEEAASFVVLGALAAREGGLSGLGGGSTPPLVLGLRTGGTRELAEQLGGEHLLDVKGLGAFEKAFNEALGKNRMIYINVTGLYGKTLREKINNAIEAGSYGLAGDQVTNWELYQLQQRGILDRAKFVDNGVLVGNPGGW